MCATMVKLSQKVNSRNNNFDILRFLAASAVIASHNFALFGLNEPLIYNYSTFGGIGVNIFFIISGFLITKSWKEKPQIGIFLKKRILRIFPALSISIFFSSFVIGPLVTTLKFQEFVKQIGKEYFTNVGSWDFTETVLIHFNLPGVFLENPIPNSINGALWTLPIEFALYVVICITGFSGLINKRQFFSAITISFIIINWLAVFDVGFQNYEMIRSILIFGIRLPIYFFIGSIMYLYSEKVLLDIKIAIFAFILFVSFLNSPYVTFIAYFTIPYIVIYFAFKGPMILRNFGKYGDFSYGMYIYAWPIQQTLVYILADKISFTEFFIAVFIITLLFAFISWHLIEKSALNLKNKKFLPKLF